MNFFNPLSKPISPRTLIQVSLICLVWMLPLATFGQSDLVNYATTWTISNHRDTDTGKTTSQGSIVRVNNQTIEWGPSLSDLFPMNITGSQGTWNKKTNKGTVTFNVVVDENDGRGTVTFTGGSNGIAIDINLKYSNGYTNLQLNCSRVKYETK